MSRRFDLLVFDWDGTLMDSTAVIVKSIQSSCRDLGLPVPDDARAGHVIGLGLKDALTYAVPELATADYPKMAERYSHHFRSHDNQMAPFGGVDTMLRDLADAGFMLAVATGKSRAGLDRVFNSTGLGASFIASRCADECFSKPHPAMLLELMDQLGVTPARTLMIGDTTHDLQMAINAGVAGLGVTYGAHPKPQLEELRPLATVNHIGELASWLRAHA